MTEELKAVLDTVTPATPDVAKIKPGNIIIAIELDRDPARSGKYTTSIGGRGQKGVAEWRVGGRIVAIKAGKVIAKNHLSGAWSAVSGHYSVNACRAVFCPKCVDSQGTPKAVMLPHAVWDAKDRLRKSGKDAKGWGAWRVLREAGRCECGERLYEDVDLENARLNSLVQKALKDVEGMETVPDFVPPTFFTLVSPGKGSLPQQWAWLQNGLAHATPNPCSAVLHRKGERKALMYNPGYWIGQAESLDAAGLKSLFFNDTAGISEEFNPNGIEGL